MFNRIRGALLVALLLLAVAVPVAGAAPVSVNLRVEGVSGTIFEAPVTTDAHQVTTPTDMGTTRICDGTNVGNPPGPTATGALDDASRLAGFAWDGQWQAPSFQDYYYDQIGPDRVDRSTHYWSLWINWGFATAGGCGQPVKQGDEVLWAYEDFAHSPILRLSGPNAVRTGERFSVKVVDGFDGSLESGALVSGATTGTDGEAALSFADPGIYRIKAEKPGAIRSNALVICADPPEADPCSSGDKAKPSLELDLPGERLASERGRSRTMLVSWQADDAAGAGLSYYSAEVREVTGGLAAAQLKVGEWRTLRARTDLPRVHFRGESGKAYQFRIGAVDRAANRTAVETDPIVLPVDDRDRGLWRFSKGWKRARRKSAWGHTVITAKRTGASATLRFEGRSVALIGRKLPKGGRLRVTLDGNSRTLLLRGRSAPRTVLWQSKKRRDDKHVLRIRSLGGGPVQLDAVAPQP